MRFSLRPGRGAEDDLFTPLRELRSPLSMEKIKTIVFHHAAGKFSVWNHLWSLAAEFLALSAVAGVLYHYSESTPDSGYTPAAKHTIAQATSEQMWSPSTGLRSPLQQNPSSDQPDISSSERSELPVIGNVSSVEARSLPIENPGMKSTNAEIENAYPISTSMPSASPSWFATASSGAVFSHLRLLGESAEIGMDHGWESIGIAFSNASGNRDHHDVLEHRSTTSSLFFSESDQTLAILVGANYSIGPVSGKAELGPAYLFSSSRFIDPVTEALGSSNVNNRIGLAAEISAFYNVNDFFQAGVTGISSYRIGQFTSGILISINIRP